MTTICIKRGETQMTTICIKDLCNWSEPKRVDTKKGPRMLRTARPSEEFWRIWRKSKDSLKQAGVSCSKFDGVWGVNWWQELSEAQQTAEQSVLDSSRAVDSDFDPPKPDGLEYLGYQIAGIEYALQRDATLIGDEMGLGKTIQAIGVANCVEPRTVLVICPASLRVNWQREWETWTTQSGIQTHVVTSGKPSAWPTDFDPNRPRVIIINYDLLGKHLAAIQELRIDLLIVDESHYCKNPKAVRTRRTLALKAEKKLFLSGTPILNRPVELWPLVESTDPEGLGRSFFGFVNRYCAPKKVWTGRKYVNDYSGAANLDELQNRLRRSIMVRRLKAEVLTELPVKRRQIVPLPAGTSRVVKQDQKAFREHLENLERLRTAVEQADTDESYAQAVAELRHGEKYLFDEMSSIRHETALAKVPLIIEHLRDALESGPVVFFGWHRDVIAAVAGAFERVAVITGDTSLTDRQQAVDDFQNGKVDLICGNIKAMGVGLTLTRSSHVVLGELPWTPGDATQAEDRCHRIGQTDSVLVQHLVFESSIDAYMAQLLVDKQVVLDATLDAKVRREIQKPQQPTEIAVDLSPDALDQLAETMSEQDKVEVHEQLGYLASRCDGAKAEDGCGFNRLDSKIGKRLANVEKLSPRQAALGKKILHKYRSTQLKDWK